MRQGDIMRQGGIMRRGYYETPLQLTLIGYSNISDTKIIIVIILSYKNCYSCFNR